MHSRVDGEPVLHVAQGWGPRQVSLGEWRAFRLEQILQCKKPSGSSSYDDHESSGAIKCMLVCGGNRNDILPCSCVHQQRGGLTSQGYVAFEHANQQ